MSSRVMFVGSRNESPKFGLIANRGELNLSEARDLLEPGDLLVLNDTGVIPCRIFTPENREILFVCRETSDTWQVLFPARGLALGKKLALPGGRIATLVRKGLPQILKIEGESLTPEYFDQYGELALPPYIQRARGERHNREKDRENYQTAWWKNLGSTAAPTASLHFSQEDLKYWAERGVGIALTTLHVGLGTFLPIKVKDLSEHIMHKEWCSIPHETLKLIEMTRSSGGRVFALGTTVARALESWASGLLSPFEGGVCGDTDLFIRPGFEFRLVDVLMTNFHQPESSLLALVCAFAGREKVMESYRWAIDNQFRLFSYGDLTIWERPSIRSNS